MRRPFIGYSILAVFTLVLVGLTAWNAWHENIVLSLIFLPFIPILVFILVRVYREASTAKDSYPLFSSKSFYDFLAAALGAIFTYIVSVYAGVGPVIASGLAGVLAAIFIRPYAVPIFCGSFLGMCNPEFLQIQHLIGASVLVGVVFVLTKDVFNGYGGKLGTIALSAAVITGFLCRCDFLAGSAYSGFETLALILASVIGALATFVISIRLGKGPVFASGIVGVLAGVVLPLVWNDFGIELAVAVFGASFVGMSSKDRLLDERFIALAGIMFGFIYVYSAPYFGGAGGKLGTIAFASAMMMAGVRIISGKVSAFVFSE